MESRKYTLRIQRNQKQDDGSVASEWQEFTVEGGETTTILTLLESVKGDQDGSLTFRQSCRSAICGSCAMRIGDRTRLACKTHIGAVVDEDGVVSISPQRNQPVLKDLVIDIDPFFKKIKEIKPYLLEGEEADTKVGASAYEQVNNVTQCIMCGSCYSDCTMSEVSENYLGPAALAKAFRFVSDPREGKKTARLYNLSKDDGMWSCVRCVQCVATCPKDVKPMEAIVKLRTRGIDKGFIDGVGQRHALAFHEDITKSGDLNEFTLLSRSVGIMGSVAELGVAMHLLKKGKIPSPFPHKAEGIQEVRAMYQDLEANPLDVETKAAEVEPE
ncbi:MAG: succinate dehydrogenase/fumarate reductase iron-sulfur subunit [Magnetococcales bacterium]|nr:succinate dehydrogenase/fumarate reductase iron-sulfur subunit [Magnetococcales bacterium]